MNLPLISILVPIYNVEQYLHQCLDSIINQTYENLQIVLVNDGSTDTSPAICDYYAHKDRRIEVIHKTNGGVASARNELLQRIHGEWFLFVDADDFIDLDMVNHLYELAQNTGTQMAMCEMTNDEDNKSERNDITENREVWLYEQVILEFLRHQRISGSLWNKLIKSELLLNSPSPTGFCFDNAISYGEDALFLWQLLHTPIMLSRTSMPLYHHRINPESISGQAWGAKKQSDEVVWKRIACECKTLFPQYYDTALARWKIQNMWQVFFAAKSNAKRDNNVKFFQKSVRDNLRLILKSDLINEKKKVFAIAAAYSYSISKILAKLV